MEKLMLFFFSTAGLTWILNRSKLFKPLRESLTYRVETMDTMHKFHVKAPLYMRILFPFFESIFGCAGCMGFWSGLLNYVLIFVINIQFLSYGFSGAIISLIIVQYSSFLDRK